MTRGNWTDKGCNLKSFHEDNKTYICECNHLTNFAVLVVSCFVVVVVLLLLLLLLVLLGGAQSLVEARYRF